MGTWAALAYLPLPGWQLVPALAAPRDRMVRFHAWQAGLQVLLLWAVLLGLALLIPDGGVGQQVVGVVVALWLLWNLALLGAGAWAAGRGRWARVQPAAAMLTLLRR